MDGLYLYCIREKTDNKKVFLTKSIDEKNEVFIFLHREIEAVVSKVPLEEFESGKIQKSAMEDPDWIKMKAVNHGRVIEEAMWRNGRFLSLIPMRFGIIFKDETGLQVALDKNYSEIMGVLEKIRGKQEWGLKIYLENKEKFSEKIKSRNALIKMKEEQITSMPEGLAYFMEEELRDIAFKAMNREIDNITESIYESLKGYAVRSVKCKILPKEITGRKETMVLNVAYLISEENVLDFQKKVEMINKDIYKEGFSIKYSGPWPAYNFTPLEI